MKYTILGFQQEKLIANKLTVEDAFVLRVIKDMFSSASMEFKEFNGVKFMWVNYTYLLEQVPIIGSKRNLMRKIERYGNDFLLLRKLQNDKNGKKGNFSYIAPTKNLDSLQDYDLMTESHKGYDKIAQGLRQNRISLMTESHNKDTSITDTSIKDNKDIKAPNKKPKLDINETINNYTENEELRITLVNFIDMRRKQKDGITDNAINLTLKKLAKIAKSDKDKIEVLEQSIMCSYKGIFPIKGAKSNGFNKQDNEQPKKPTIEYEGDRLARIAAEKFGDVGNIECDF